MECWSRGVMGGNVKVGVLELRGVGKVRAKTPGQRQGEKWAARRALLGGWRQMWLCSIIRIYTHLYAFITCFWRERYKRPKAIKPAGFA
jgi:hypothetical protein